MTVGLGNDTEMTEGQTDPNGEEFDLGTGWTDNKYRIYKEYSIYKVLSNKFFILME